MAIDKTITLGSGKLYISEFTGSIPTDAQLEVDANLLGLIKGGATLSYTPEFYTAEDDLGLAKKKMLVSEEVVFKSGIMTWKGATLTKLCSTASSTITASKRTYKFGGVANYDGKSYVLRFVHEDAENGDIRITIVGSNENGFELAFAKDKETVIDAEFKALPSDNQGTLIVFEETIPFSISPTSLTLTAGGSAGSITLTNASGTVSASAPTGITATVSGSTVSITVASGTASGAYSVSIADTRKTCAVSITVS